MYEGRFSQASCGSRRGTSIFKEALKDIQLPAISRSRLARPCRLMLLPILTVTARDCGRSRDRDIDGFFTVVDRGRITRENSNCRKTLLIVD